MKNETTVVISGLGGQGILFLGTILAKASILENKNTTWMPSYGAEMRGGRASCFVVISDSEIASPVFDESDIGIFLCKEAVKKYSPMVKENGLIIVDSNIECIKDKRFDDIPFMDLIHKSSHGFPLNVVVLGYLIKKTGVLKKENVLSVLEEVSKQKNESFVNLNKGAFNFGYEI